MPKSATLPIYLGHKELRNAFNRKGQEMVRKDLSDARMLDARRARPLSEAFHPSPGAIRYRLERPSSRP